LKTSEYYLLSVIPTFPGIVHDEYEIVDVNRVLKQARHTLEEIGAKVIQSEYLLGDARERICEYARETGIDQIVIGSHGRSGLTRLFLGSVSEWVLEHAKCPVIIHRNIRKGGNTQESSKTKEHFNVL
jgi:nucleotide-binding universal stress UspA family protein